MKRFFVKKGMNYRWNTLHLDDDLDWGIFLGRKTPGPRVFLVGWNWIWGEVDINHTSKPAGKRWSFGSCCDLMVPKNSSWKKTDANLIPTPPQEGWGCSSQSSKLWLMVANDSRHHLCRILIRTPRIINPPTLKSPTNPGLIGERWSNYVKFTLKTYSTVCW